MPIFSPVTKDHKPRPGAIWGGAWFVGVKFAQPYVISGTTGTTQHTGVDLQLANNADFHQPIYAIDTLTIRKVEIGRGKTWGWLIIAEGVDPYGYRYFLRYAHVENIQVKPGDVVQPGTVIAHVGDASGFYRGSGAHLHFDVSYTDKLFIDPSYWPDLNRSALMQHFIDPEQFLLYGANPDVYQKLAVRVTADPYVNVRLKAALAAEKIGAVALNQLPIVLTPSDNGFYKLAGRGGFISAEWVTTNTAPPPVTYTTRYVKAEPYLNVRSEPRIAPDTDVSDLEYGAEIQVNLAHPVNGFVEMPNHRWVSLAYLQADRPPPLGVPEQPPPQSDPGTRFTRIALHFITDAKPGVLLDFLLRLAVAGRPLYGLLLLKLGYQSDLAIATIKTVRPKTKVMLRGWRDHEPGYDWTMVTREDGYSHAKEYFRVWVHGDNLLADFHQIINEPGGGICPPLKVAAFWNGAMDAAAEHNPPLKLGILCYAERNPAIPSEPNRPYSDFWQSPAIHAMLARAKREGHVLMLHEYLVDPDGGAGECYTWAKDNYQAERLYRHQVIYKLLPESLRDLSLWLGEAGDLKSLKCGIAPFVENVRLYMQGIASDLYLKVVALWTVGAASSSTWEQDRIDAALDELIKMILRQ